MSLTVPVTDSSPEEHPLVLAAEVLQAGGIVVYPTETLYGIGAVAFNASAVERIQGLKGREGGKPILVLAESAEAVGGLTDEITAAARALMRAFWPGPLTLVFRVSAHFPDALTGGRGTLGIRVSASILCRRLVGLVGAPITSTSANLSGGTVLRSVADIRTQFGTDVDLYLDAGTLPERPPSTVVDVTGPVPLLLREGALSRAQMEQVVHVAHP